MNDSLYNLFFVLSQKVLIAERRLNALSGDINKVLLIKTTLQQFKAYLTMLRALLCLRATSSLYSVAPKALAV